MTKLVSRRINTFSGYEDVRDEYVAWFDVESSILHHVSSTRKNALDAKPDKDGYLRYQLIVDPSKHKIVYVHKISCEFFHGSRPADKPQVNHINHKRNDNRASNLEWASFKENTSLDPLWIANVKSAAKKSSARKSRRHPILIIVDGEIDIYASCREAASCLGYSYTQSFTDHIQPLLKGEVSEVTYYSSMLKKDVTVKLA